MSSSHLLIQPNWFELTMENQVSKKKKANIKSSKHHLQPKESQKSAVNRDLGDLIFSDIYLMNMQQNFFLAK